jgi:hypothetical protein
MGRFCFINSIVWLSTSIRSVADKRSISVSICCNCGLIALDLEFSLFQQFGETAETAPELEELANIRERLISLYNRLHNIFLRVTQSQPIASEDLLNLLYRSIEQTEISIDTSIASLQDIQRNWN